MDEIKDVSINLNEEIEIEGINKQDSSFYGTWKYVRELKKWVREEAVFKQYID